MPLFTGRSKCSSCAWEILWTEIYSSSDLDCARNMIDRWATAKALLVPPTTLEAIRQRARFAIGLNIVAIKLRSAGHPVASVSADWLQRLSNVAVDDFRKRANKSGWIDNLYVWSGVNAASSALLTNDREMRAYATEVWQRSIAQIAPDGSLKSELARGGARVTVPSVLFVRFAHVEIASVKAQ